MQQSLTQAHHLVIVAPSGGATCQPGSGAAGSHPAAGFRLSLPAGKAHPEQLLAGKTARLLLTMDSPLVLPLVAGAPGAHPGQASAGAVRYPADPPPASGARPHLG